MKTKTNPTTKLFDLTYEQIDKLNIELFERSKFRIWILGSNYFLGAIHPYSVVSLCSNRTVSEVWKAAKVLYALTTEPTEAPKTLDSEGNTFEKFGRVWKRHDKNPAPPKEAIEAGQCFMLLNGEMKGSEVYSDDIVPVCSASNWSCVVGYQIA